MSKSVTSALLDIDPLITDALGAAAILEVLSEQLFTIRPADNRRWEFTDMEVDALRFAIRTSCLATEAIDGAHRALFK